MRQSSQRLSHPVPLRGLGLAVVAVALLMAVGCGGPSGPVIPKQKPQTQMLTLGLLDDLALQRATAMDHETTQNDSPLTTPARSTRSRVRRADE